MTSHFLIAFYEMETSDVCIAQRRAAKTIFFSFAGRKIDLIKERGKERRRRFLIFHSCTRRRCFDAKGKFSLEIKDPFCRLLVNYYNCA